MPFSLPLMLASTVVALCLAMVVGRIAAARGFPVPDESRRVGHIDGLRGYLALLVMTQHFSVWVMMTQGGGWQAPPDPMLSNFGVLSVMIFFMITGFLFFGKVANGFRATNWQALYISRAFRILPLQAVVVLAASVIALIMQGFAIGETWKIYPVRAAQWFFSYSQPDLFGYPGSGIINALVLWSIAYEWLFYFLVLPVLALCMSWAPLARRPLLIGLAMILIGLAAHALHPAPLFLDSLQAFGFGVLVRIVIMRGAPEVLRSPLVAVLSGALMVFAFTMTNSALNPGVLAILAFFFLCVAAGNSFGGLFSNRGALVLGESSFSIYMLHGIVLFVGFKALSPLLAELALSQLILLLPLFVLAAVLVSIASYRLIERPSIAGGKVFGRWAASARRGDPAAART